MQLLQEQAGEAEAARAKAVERAEALAHELQSKYYDFFELYRASCLYYDLTLVSMPCSHAEERAR